MAFVQPATLQQGNVRLEPLTLAHEEGLRQAAADGELWNLRITSVPAPDATRAYIETALAAHEQGQRFAFAVIDTTTGEVTEDAALFT